MKRIINLIENLKRSDVRKAVDSRIKEFSRRKKDDEIFKELCFCILTANFDAERTIRIEKEIGDGFLLLPEKQLAEKLKKLGHRFPNTRAGYITEAREKKDELKDVLGSKDENKIREWQIREWLVENIKGIGMKESSHCQKARRHRWSKTSGMLARWRSLGLLAFFPD